VRQGSIAAARSSSRGQSLLRRSERMTQSEKMAVHNPLKQSVPSRKDSSGTWAFGDKNLQMSLSDMNYLTFRKTSGLALKKPISERVFGISDRGISLIAKGNPENFDPLISHLHNGRDFVSVKHLLVATELIV
jgi:hypothetical protein